MYESTQAAHRQVESVSYQEYQGKSNPAETDTSVSDGHCSDVIESLPQVFLQAYGS